MCSVWLFNLSDSQAYENKYWLYFFYLLHSITNYLLFINYTSVRPWTSLWHGTGLFGNMAVSMSHLFTIYYIYIIYYLLNAIWLCPCRIYLLFTIFTFYLLHAIWLCPCRIYRLFTILYFSWQHGCLQLFTIHYTQSCYRLVYGRV